MTSHSHKTAYRRKPKQARSIRTVDRALKAAGSVLDRKGFDGFSMEAVADEANVAIGTLYQYFPDKYAILRVLVGIWYDKSNLHDENSTSLVPDVEAQAEVYFDQTGGPALLEAIQVVPELREYDRMKMELAVGRFAQRLSGGGAPTPEQIALARVTTFAIDAVLRQAAKLPRDEAMDTVAVLKKWMHALYPDTGY